MVRRQKAISDKENLQKAKAKAAADKKKAASLAKKVRASLENDHVALVDRQKTTPPLPGLVVHKGRQIPTNVLANRSLIWVS